MIRFEATIAALAIGITISLSGPAAAENVLRFTGFRTLCGHHGSAFVCH